MKENEILEGNKLIAEFMGVKIIPESGDYYSDNHTNPNHIVNLKYKKYHSSWDWLMPVVEKIAKTGWKFNLNSRKVSNDASFVNGENFIQAIAWSTPLLATYNVVIDFIHWYTLNPPPSVAKG